MAFPPSFSIVLAVFFTRKSKSSIACFLIITGGVVLTLLGMSFLPDLLGLDITEEPRRISPLANYPMSNGKFFGLILGAALFGSIAQYLKEVIEKKIGF